MIQIIMDDADSIFYWEAIKTTIKGTKRTKIQNVAMDFVDVW